MMVLLPGVATAQQFVEETETRLPQPGPTEYTHQVALGDVDGDGDLDVLFANANAYDKPAAGSAVHPTRLLINDGAGVFTDETEGRLDLDPGWYRDADFCDLDGDGDDDLLLAGGFGFEPRILMNDGAGHFSDETAVRAPEYDGFWGSAIACGDVDMDGDLDLYVTSAGTKMFAPPGGQDRLWLNAGAGKFFDVTASHLPDLVTRASLQVRFLDVDNDADLDVVVTNRDIKSNLLLNNGQGRFSDGSFLLVKDGKHSYAITVGDLNGDGLPDLLVANGSASSSQRELLMINSVTGTSAGFVDATDLLMGAAGANPKADDNEAELFDLDDDGDLDVFIAAISPGAERVLLNDGGGFLSVAENVMAGPSDATLDLEFGDLDGDGRADLITAQGESGNFTNRVYMNTGPIDTKAPVVTNVKAGGATGAYLGPVAIVARVTDAFTGDAAPVLAEVIVDGTPMVWAGGSLFRGAVQDGLIKAAFTVKVTATDASGNATSSGEVTISPRHPLDVFDDGTVDDKDLNLIVDHLVDKGGLGPEGDIDGDGDVDLGDAQLLASGIGGSPIVSRVHQTDSGAWLLLGANLTGGSVGGGAFTVVDGGPFSILATLQGELDGAISVTAGGQDSNELEVTP